jgi:predicted nucleotidyltransferase
MLNNAEKALILTCAQKYSVTELYLFGSSLESDEYQDIDLGVKGIPAERFFTFYGELLRKLSKPVDVVDLSRPSLFTELIQREGMKLYG